MVMKTIFFILLFTITLLAQFTGFGNYDKFSKFEIGSDITPPIVTSTDLDTLGNDSLEYIITGLVASDADALYWVVFSDTLSKLDTTGVNVGDSVITSQTTADIDTTHWKWTGIDGIYKYAKLYVSDGLNTADYTDSINVPYNVAPGSGTITLNGYLQYNDLDLSINYGGNADID